MSTPHTDRQDVLLDNPTGSEGKEKEVERKASAKRAARELAGPDALEQCQEILGKLELELEEENHAQAVADAVERVLKIFDVRRYESAEAHRMVLLREYMKVLCATEFRDELIEALEEALTNRTLIKARKKAFKDINKMLSPGKDHPGDYFDPASWDIGKVPAKTREERLVRLGYFIEGMMEQETGMHEAGASIVDAANHTVKERTGPERDLIQPAERKERAREAKRRRKKSRRG